MLATCRKKPVTPPPPDFSAAPATLLRFFSVLAVEPKSFWIDESRLDVGAAPPPNDDVSNALFFLRGVLLLLLFCWLIFLMLLQKNLADQLISL